MMNMREKCIVAALILAKLACWGQEGNVFQRFSLSGGLGSTGLTIDMGTMMTDHFGRNTVYPVITIRLSGRLQ